MQQNQPADVYKRQREIPCDQHGALRHVRDGRFTAPQQNRQQAGADILYVRGTLRQQFVACRGKQLDV